jgi:hypothetical protein
MVTANRGLGLLTGGVAPHLLEPPANAMRIALHPEGMAPRILNWRDWRHHALARIERQARLTGEAAMAELHEELAAFPAPGGEDRSGGGHEHEVFMPLLMRGPGGEELNFFSTVATFGTAVDVTVAELSIESFFPADDATAAACRAFAPR